MRPDRVGPHTIVDSEQPLYTVPGADITATLAAAFPSLVGVVRTVSLPSIEENYQAQNFVLSGAAIPNSGLFKTLTFGVLLQGLPLEDMIEQNYMYQLSCSVNIVSDVSIPAGLWSAVIGKLDSTPSSGTSFAISRYTLIPSVDSLYTSFGQSVSFVGNGPLGDIARQNGAIDPYPIFFGVRFLVFAGAAYNLYGNVSVGAHVWTKDMKIYNPQSN